MWEALRSWVSFKASAPGSLTQSVKSGARRPAHASASCHLTSSSRSLGVASGSEGSEIFSLPWKIPRAADSFFFFFFFFYKKKEQTRKQGEKKNAQPSTDDTASAGASSLFPVWLHDSKSKEIPLQRNFLSFSTGSCSGSYFKLQGKEKKKRTVQVSVCVNSTINLTFAFCLKAQSRVVAFEGSLLILRS